jgi:uncharacterized protein
MRERRTQALNLLNRHIQNPRMIAHCLASEAVMKQLALFFGEDPEEWELCGLLHDIDVEITHADANIHGTKARELLSELHLSEETLEAIERHNEMSTPAPRNKKIHHALAAAETITGLIFATAMVYPDKKISSIKPKSVVKRMKEKLFAASVKRENILECEQIGLSLPEFAEMAIEALIPIEQELGF